MATAVGFGSLRAAQEDLHVKIEFGKPELKGNERRLVVIAIVLTAEGKPAKGWSVRFYKNTEPEDKLVETESSGRAKKEFSGLKSEKYTFKAAVVADGREIAQETDSFEIEETREFKLETGEVEQHGDKFTVPVSARLIDTAFKRPISNAGVTLSCDATPVSLKTDSNGRFWYDFSDLNVGSRRFEAAMPGSSVEPAVLILPLKDKRKINRVDTEPIEEEGELKLVVPGTVAAYDRPIEGTDIQGYLDTEKYGATQVTKSDGRFVLVFKDLKEGTRNFEIRIPGTKIVDSFTKEIREAKPKRPVKLVADDRYAPDGTCTLHFHALAEEDKPVAHATISVHENYGSRTEEIKTDKAGTAIYKVATLPTKRGTLVEARILGSNVTWFRNIYARP